MKKFYSHFFVSIVMCLPLAFSQAETVDCSDPVNKDKCLVNPLDSSIGSIPALFQAILDILIIFAVPLVVFFIILAGFKYVTARGNAETIKQAHQALLYALIGGVLILGANVLLVIINNTICSVTGSSPTNNCGT